MKKLLLLNGPNLNLLGTREPAVYGAATLADVEAMCRAEGHALGVEVHAFQSNHEGALIDRVHAARTEGIDFIVINPGAFTHTSIALRDAFAGVAIPFIEVHISNVHKREPFRHHSYFSDLAAGVIVGLRHRGLSLRDQGGRSRNERPKHDHALHHHRRHHRLAAEEEGQPGGADHAWPSRSSRRTQAFEAGATLVHLHVRNDDGSPTSDAERFAEVLDGIRKHCPGIITQVSTGGRSGAGRERGGMLSPEARHGVARHRLGQLPDPRLRQLARPRRLARRRDAARTASSPRSRRSTCR